jgi:hypothetical protein
VPDLAVAEVQQVLARLQQYHRPVDITAPSTAWALSRWYVPDTRPGVGSEIGSSVTE